MIPATIGNIIGGSVCVGLAYWAIYKHKSAPRAVNQGSAA